MKRTFLRLLIGLLPISALASETKDDIHLFQTFFRDASTAENRYGEAILGFSDFDFANSFNLGVRAGVPVSSQFEVGAGLAFLNVNPEFGNSTSGLSDLRFSGKYHLDSPSETKFTVGGFITLPIGKQSLGQSEGNFGGFGALRHPLGNRTVLTGVLGLEFLKGSPTQEGGWPFTAIGPSRETSLLLGGGVIQELKDNFHLVGELNFSTEGEYAMLSGGVDLERDSGNRFRGLLGFGVDDGAPDISLLASYLLFFN